MEKPDYSLNSLKGVTVPVPVSPLYFIYDTHYFSSVGTYVWEWTVPPDLMVYSITNFVLNGDELTWFCARVRINEVEVFYQYHGFPLIWTPANERAVRLSAGDVIEVTVVHVATLPHNYYWCMDFWREPQA